MAAGGRGGAAEIRGVWWWTSANNAWGVDRVLGDKAKAAEMIRFLNAWNFDRVYCSFSTDTRAHPALIYAWNSKLHAAGISSQFLLGENTWIFPDSRPNLLSVHIQSDFLDFNAAATNAAGRYDAVHLDIEPHGLPAWNVASPNERKHLLRLLRDTVREVRSYLDAHAAKDIPIYADLPVWFDQVGKPVGWDSAGERDAWFADMAQALAGISLMAYERNTAARIDSGVAWEIQTFKNEVRVGLEASVGVGKTWSSTSNLLTMIQTQESSNPPRRVDIHDFVQFHEIVTKPQKTNAP